MASLYGLNPKDYQMTPAGLTIAEIERMRQIVNQADAANKGGQNEFDLAKPPVPPYRHQEYPRCMYHHATGRSKNAQNQEEVEAAIKAGWTTQAFVPKVEKIDEFAGLSAEDAAEARSADEALGIAKPKPARRGGRQKKAAVQADGE